MYYPDELVEEVRSRNDIVEVVGSYVRLQKKGASYFGLCPFHNEKSPSFSVSPHKQMYYCFGCGAGGNVFTFLMNYENDTFPEAIKTLADRAGIDLPEIEYSEEMKKEADKKALLLEINKEAAKYFYYQLRSPQGQIGHQYLTKRELSEETMKQFGLGYSNKFSNDLVQYLKQKGYADELIIQAGLAAGNEVKGVHDKFWNRVMFPIQDINHRVIGFGGRVMGEGEPKYLNSPETMIFDKSRNLYGLNFARSSRRDHIILCEGYMDVISMHQAGFTQAVASLGTAFTSGQANLLHRFTDTVVLSYDSDGAGTKAALRAIGILRENGMTARVLNLEPYKDPDEFIKNLGAQAFEERIKQAENSFLFELRVLQRDYNLQDPDEKTAFYKEIAKKLCTFSDEVERENYIEAVADKYGIGFESLRNMVNSLGNRQGLIKPLERPKSGIQSKPSAQDAVTRSQGLLLTWLIEEPVVYQKIKKYISSQDFTVEPYGKAAQHLLADLDKGVCEPASIISLFSDEEEQRKIAALFNTKLPPVENLSEKEKALKDVVLAVKRNSYEESTKKLGQDVSSLNRVIEGKKALEELTKTHISLDS